MNSISSHRSRRIATDCIDRAVHSLELSSASGFDRRRFLSTSASALATGLLTACGLAGNDKAERILFDVSRKNETVERFLMRHTSMNAGAPGAIIAGAKFPSYHISKVVPEWNGAARGPWRLEVSGLVSTPLSLDLPSLMALRQTTQRVEHFCVEGWNAVGRFTGVRVAELARLAGALPSAQFVDFQSFDDGFHESWDLESAMHPQTLVVYGKEGQLLSPAYGAPARVQSPVKLGYKNTKYLTKIVFMAERNGGYWTDFGYEWYGGT